MNLPSGYQLRPGSGLDRALLVKFMQRTYQELFPGHDVAHLAQTVEQYFSTEAPLFWVELSGAPPRSNPLGCLWMGTAIDQIQGDRYPYIFLLYVHPDHRHQGIGTALMQKVEDWAKERGDRQVGLQVFVQNQAALRLYEKLGYQPQSIFMVKPLPR
ncbi:GNAT family N-acetyltransferase [Leptolyngbya ohadii]|uniref:GNAT family N-acetyltransferase n=1 Tax=Leptolyngbya ohadii TaxID=1962290 RepID=UPI000B5A148F|nr:GNAT family N-acetyltransferase [Leptolyngbya ohadii]